MKEYNLSFKEMLIATRVTLLLCCFSVHCSELENIYLKSVKSSEFFSM